MQRVLKLLRDNRGFLLFIFGMFVFRSAVADWYQIPSGSMEPTLQVGDRVFVDNRAFNLRVPFTNIHVLDYGAPRAGEVITFKSPVDGERLIKRVVAVAGQRVEAHDGQLFVDDQAVPGHAGHAPRVAHQAHFVNAAIAQDLRPDAVGAQVHAASLRCLDSMPSALPKRCPAWCKRSFP